MKNIFFGLITAMFLTACSQHPIKEDVSSEAQKITPLASAYDFRIIDSNNREIISITQLASRLKDIDVVFLGEYHGNHASHLLQAQLQAALYQLRPNQVLTMEQFTTDNQSAIDDYMDEEIGEKMLIKQGDAWNNYVASYRPLVEFSKRHSLPVYAANAPASYVRCVGRHGESYLTKFKADGNLPKQPFLSEQAYEDKFMGFMGKMRKSARIPRRSYSAQLLRDNSMAETIIRALEDNPKAQVIHTNGAFHSDSFLGTAGLVKKRNPALKIAVISPIHVKNIEKPTYHTDDLKKGSFIYLLSKQPDNYKQAKNRMASFKAMFKRSNRKICE